MLKEMYRKFELEVIGNHSGSLLNKLQNLDSRVHSVESDDSTAKRDFSTRQKMLLLEPEDY